MNINTGKNRQVLALGVPDRHQMWVSSHTESQRDSLHGNFINLISQEIKTPITSIKGYVQLLLMMLDEQKDILVPAEFTTSLLRIDKQIRQLTGMITEMVDLSRIEAGKLEKFDEKFSINSLVEESVETILSHNSKQIIRTIAEENFYVRADKSRILHVMLNFLTNAVKNSNNSKEIIVQIARKNEEVVVSVRGNDQIYPGFGIGLYISKSIIEKYNGSIGVKNEPGNGSVFMFCLPIVSSQIISNGTNYKNTDS